MGFFIFILLSGATWVWIVRRSCGRDIEEGEELVSFPLTHVTTNQPFQKHTHARPLPPLPGLHGVRNEGQPPPAAAAATDDQQTSRNLLCSFLAFDMLTKPVVANLRVSGESS